MKLFRILTKLSQYFVDSSKCHVYRCCKGDLVVVLLVGGEPPDHPVPVLGCEPLHLEVGGGGVELVPGGRRVPAPQVAGGQVLDPGLGVHHLRKADQWPPNMIIL